MVAQPVADAVEVEHDGAAQESVKHGGGDGGIAEDLAPGGDSAVGGEQEFPTPTWRWVRTADQPTSAGLELALPLARGFHGTAT